MPTRLPALGLGVLQLQLGLDGHRTLPSSVRVYLHGRQLAVGRHEAFPLRVIDSGTSDFALSNRYMQVWFSGLSGLLKVKGKGGNQGRAGMGLGPDPGDSTLAPSCQQGKQGVASWGKFIHALPGGRPDMPVWGQGSGLCFLAEHPKGG